MDPEWMTAYATSFLAIATLFLAAVAAFQDRIRSWVMRPRLHVSMNVSPPDCPRGLKGEQILHQRPDCTIPASGAVIMRFGVRLHHCTTSHTLGGRGWNLLDCSSVGKETCLAFPLGAIGAMSVLCV
jgi:hypothetical protein